MDVLVKALGALWQVVAVGLLLGAGLPALFALGIRSLNSSRTVVVSAVAAGWSRARARRGEQGQPGGPGRGHRLLQYRRARGVCSVSS